MAEYISNHSEYLASIFSSEEPQIIVKEKKKEKQVKVEKKANKDDGKISTNK